MLSCGSRHLIKKKATRIYILRLYLIIKKLEQDKTERKEIDNSLQEEDKFWPDIHFCPQKDPCQFMECAGYCRKTKKQINPALITTEFAHSEYHVVVCHFCQPTFPVWSFPNNRLLFMNRSIFYTVSRHTHSFPSSSFLKDTTSDKLIAVRRLFSIVEFVPARRYSDYVIGLLLIRINTIYV